jgi:hypothetical protein
MQAATDIFAAMRIGAKMQLRPRAKLSQPRLGSKGGVDVGLVERNGGVGGAAVIARVMIDAQRYHQGVCGLHIVTPLRHAMGEAGQHPDRDPIVAQHASGPYADGKCAGRERQAANRHMSQMSAQASALKLHGLDVGAGNCVVDFLEAVDAARLHRNIFTHRTGPCDAVTSIGL